MCIGSCNGNFFFRTKYTFLTYRCINDRVTEYRRLSLTRHVLQRTCRGKITSFAFAAVTSVDVVSLVLTVVI